MKSRLLTAGIALPILFASIVLPLWWREGTWVFLLIAAVALGAGLFEFFSLTKKLALKADAGIGYLGAALLFAAFALGAADAFPDLLLIALAVFLIVLLVSQTFRFALDFPKMLTGVGVTALAVMYVAFLGGFLVATRVGFENSPGLSTYLLAYFFLVIFASDVGAYAAGRLLGKHKLAPAISPAKTVEGLVGGLVAAAAAGALATLLFFPALPYHISISLAVVLAALGVVGDLAESAMKRAAGAKDAATILPGHGGFLDRLDSLLFGAPVLYYFAKAYFT